MSDITLFLAICFFSLFLYWSCASGNSKAKSGLNEAPEKGKVIEKVKCEKDKSVNYSLYVPSQYDSTQKYPLIIAFDSHADGVRPVKLFQNQAEEHAYIVAGSNNSKNGQPWTTTEKIYNIMLEDLTHKFNIDLNRIYTTGFSGGSRVASNIAIEKGGISAVAGFSAGFPNMAQTKNKNFDYIGIVGNADFNYNEMVQLDSWLGNNQFNHYLIIFDGKHEWAPEYVIEDIFYWFEFCAMRKGLLSKKELLINTFLDTQLSEINKFNVEKKYYEEYLKYKKIISFLKGISDIDKYIEIKNQLEQNPLVKNMLKQIENDYQKEQSLQQHYQKSILEKDIEWWDREVKSINTLIEKGNSESFLYKRINSYLSIVAYSYSNNALNRNLLEDAARYISVYKLVDPTNPEADYMQSILYVRKADLNEALVALEKAVDLGFKDIERMQNDTDIVKLTSFKAYYDIIKKIN